jgi:hypothetical protein
VHAAVFLNNSLIGDFTHERPCLGRRLRLGSSTIPPTNERGLLYRWYDRDNPSSWDLGSIFLDGPNQTEKS